MLVTVDYAEERLDFDLPEDRVAGVWRGPEGLAPAAFEAAVRQALREPLEYPAAGRLVVPGDRATLAVDPAAEGLEVVLRVLTETLFQAGVEAADLTLIAPPSAPGREFWRPEGATAVVHDPGDAGGIAYLASTTSGRRIYLSRRLTDSDLVIPIAAARPGPNAPRGPWRLIHPELSNDDARRDRPERGAKPVPRGEETIHPAIEPSWLLGSRFHVALVPAARGVLEVIAGRDDAVHDRALASLERHWRFEPPDRASLVVAGVGGTTLDDLALALATATTLVDRGGRIVVLSKAGGTIGPALGRLIGADLPGRAHDALAGSEHESDHPAALAIAQATAWADVFLLSALDPQTVEDLGVTPFDRPEQARKLAAAAPSSIYINRAELTQTRPATP